eukprot:scaffold569891_cov17-Prasinocladus_malaysianus.AAC.1
MHAQCTLTVFWPFCTLMAWHIEFSGAQEHLVSRAITIKVTAFQTLFSKLSSTRCNDWIIDMA